VTLRGSLGDAKSSLGDAKSSTWPFPREEGVWAGGYLARAVPPAASTPAPLTYDAVGSSNRRRCTTPANAMNQRVFLTQAAAEELVDTRAAHAAALAAKHAEAAAVRAAAAEVEGRLYHKLSAQEQQIAVLDEALTLHRQEFTEVRCGFERRGIEAAVASEPRSHPPAFVHSLSLSTH
jgi:hypothetical protein